MAEGFRADAAGGARVASAPVEVSAPKIEQRSIIRTGSVTLRVDQLPQAEASLRKIARQENGWIDGLDGGETQTVATLRIPSDQFDATMDKVLALGKPMARNVSQEDVTDQIVDLGARMKALLAEETAYVGMLAQTRSLGDTLQVRERLGAVRQQIEQADASRTQLSRQAAMSTLTVTLLPVPVATPAAQDPAWFPAILADAVAAFGSVLRIGTTLVVYLVVFSPFWIPVAWILRRLAKTVHPSVSER